MTLKRCRSSLRPIVVWGMLTHGLKSYISLVTKKCMWIFLYVAWRDLNHSNLNVERIKPLLSQYLWFFFFSNFCPVNNYKHNICNGFLYKRAQTQSDWRRAFSMFLIFAVLKKFSCIKVWTWTRPFHALIMLLWVRWCCLDGMGTCLILLLVFFLVFFLFSIRLRIFLFNFLP